ncbi:hypothetical protein CLPUN_42260 [Clostridium puniceum]|uniref:Uncharacterized protein n=1 Tax=Clostridium puniceum TaxID=29367 RepID=A0A1S8T8H0_9CLOT|nr:hypothetical protein [Clostridium puniceum]OOM73988.1 hypothetical protein CLPUN_42260 [Clostridium puniceum]
MKDLELEKKINEEITSDYWQKLIMFNPSVDWDELKIERTFFNVASSSVSYIYIYKNVLDNIEIPMRELGVSSFIEINLSNNRVVREKIVRKIIKQKIENEEIKNSYLKEDVKTELWVETTRGSLCFRKIKDTDIYVRKNIMHFGTLGAVNLNEFISYQFEEIKETKKSE